MKKIIVGAFSAVAIMGLAACSDSSDQTTTQGIQPPANDQTMTPAPAEPAQPATPNAAPADNGGAAGGGTTAPAAPAQ